VVGTFCLEIRRTYHAAEEIHDEAEAFRKDVEEGIFALQ